MKTVLRAVGAVLIVLVIYLVAWPVPADPVAWVAPVAPGYVDDFSANKRLASLRTISLGDEEGPEHVALGPDGKLYVAVASGKVLRMNPDGTGQQVFADTGGRVLGFDFDAQGNMVAADALRGLLSITPNGAITVLLSQIGGTRLSYPDAVVVARNGMIYLSDASTRFAPRDWGGTFEASVLDILEQSCTGRILAYDPVSRETVIMASGLAFANGMALSGDQQSLFVSETGKYRIWKLPVLAQHLDLSLPVPSSAASIVFDNLPGYPDNLMRGLDGKIWAGLVKPRNATVDKMANQPFLRKMTLRLPRVLWPVPQPYGHVFAFKEDGTVVANLQDPSGAYPETTAVTETADRLYVQSLHAKVLGWLPK